MKKNLLIIVFSVLFLLKCDGGIEPEPVKPEGPTGFKGTITFTGIWPEGVKRTHLVVFKKPIEKTEDFFPPNLSFVSDSIPYGSSVFNYSSIENNFLPILQLGEGTYSYVVVAQSKTETISFERKDWYVVGVYCNNNNQSSPKELKLRAGEITEGVNINVDFNNPPPQPPY
ncbi:hypothetical protein [Melioribacter sp. OK-6-Me]|uniref:hypothetical protein n=1 Tax=unclassified Melioribacter TaxID=2627329 RepID=UPI003ED8EABA